MKKEKEVVVRPKKKLEIEDVEKDREEELKGDNSLESSRLRAIKGLAMDINTQGFVRKRDFMSGSIKMGIEIRERVEVREEE